MCSTTELTSHDPFEWPRLFRQGFLADAGALYTPLFRKASLFFKKSGFFEPGDGCFHRLESLHEQLR